mmetsp:Transcript_52161/g.93040  ORF Transcript_52161/g.93040 Transcript_52161/m.93040 type:complete len:110 (-) Transcript_52161:226-555(-)
MASKAQRSAIIAKHNGVCDHCKKKGSQAVCVACDVCFHTHCPPHRCPPASPSPGSGAPAASTASAASPPTPSPLPGLPSWSPSPARNPNGHRCGCGHPGRCDSWQASET